MLSVQIPYPSVVQFLSSDENRIARQSSLFSSALVAFCWAAARRRLLLVEGSTKDGGCCAVLTAASQRRQAYCGSLKMNATTLLSCLLSYQSRACRLWSPIDVSSNSFHVALVRKLHPKSQEARRFVVGRGCSEGNGLDEPDLGLVRNGLSCRKAAKRQRQWRRGADCAFPLGRVSTS